MGIPIVQSAEALPAPGAPPENRFYTLRGLFWETQGQLARALAQNRAVSSDCIMDMTLAKSRLAQFVRFDFRGHGLKRADMDIPSAVKQIASTIAAKRKEKGLTQVALAKAIGMSAANLARIESGERRLSIVAIYDIAAALEIDVSQLISSEILFHTDKLSRDQIRKIRAAIPAMMRNLDEREKELDARGE